MRNFRIVRIDVLTGKASLVADHLSEHAAWSRADSLERHESVRQSRRYWFAATNISDYKLAAREFLNYRRTFAY